jgi:hypothetical protein
MTIVVANTGTTNNWQYFINRVNELAYAMTSNVVTTDSNTATGNAAISGTFTANSVVANTVKIANATSNVTISVPNTAVVSNGNFYLNANGAWAPIVPSVVSSSLITAGTSAQEIDNYAMASYGGAEFFVRVKDFAANAYQAAKILTFHNNATAFSTEYGSMISNTSLGTFAVTSNATHVSLQFTPTPANTIVTISRVNF